MIKPLIECGNYIHFKGGLYVVTGVGRNANSSEYFVLYKPMWTGNHDDIHRSYWIRPFASFVEDIELNGSKVPRFRKIMPDEFESLYREYCDKYKKLVLNINPIIKSGCYIHFKGDMYMVLGSGRHSETLEDFIVYNSAWSGNIDQPNFDYIVRPASEFLDNLTIDGKVVPRFREVLSEEFDVLYDSYCKRHVNNNEYVDE
jgi:hypothetical protein